MHSITVGTLLERCRRAEPWMMAIWLTERGVPLSSVCLHEIAAIAQSSALNILRKIRVVVQSEMEDGAILMPSSEFTSIMNRRSLETPSRMHPRTEEEEYTKERATDEPEVDSAANSNSCSKDPLETVLQFMPAILHDKVRLVWMKLEEGPMFFDDLVEALGLSVPELNSIMGAFEIDGLIERLGGNRFVRPDCFDARTFQRDNCARATSQYRDGFEGQHVLTGNDSKRVNGHPIKNDRPGCEQRRGGPQSLLHDSYINDSLDKLRTRVVKFVVHFFNGVSRKYLQLYLAAFWCFADKLLGRDDYIFRLCLTSPPQRYMDLLQYISHSPVKIATDSVKSR
ncbi:MAG TPA: hypothetical protein V6C86_16605 [Oculatellaceae cyanobacterium]